jgi:antitoxin VapB
MGINIKNAETERLIRELARLTGEGRTEAVTKAVREKIERVKRPRKPGQRLDAMLTIAREMAPRLAALDLDDARYGPQGLYDRKSGLPR